MRQEALEGDDGKSQLYGWEKRKRVKRVCFRSLNDAIRNPPPPHVWKVRFGSSVELELFARRLKREFTLRD